MTLKEFRELDNEEFKSLKKKFKNVKDDISIVLEAMFETYRTLEIGVGEMAGSGPLHQFCNEVVREFIRKA